MLNAFWRVAPSVRRICLASVAAGVRLREAALSNWISRGVHSRRFFAAFNTAVVVFPVIVVTPCFTGCQTKQTYSNQIRDGKGEFWLRVLYAFPPNYAELNRRFNVRGKPVIFTFGETIFNPGRIKIPPELMVHEEVHCQRQGADVDAWWASYTADDQFRFAEELPAHVAEWANICARTDAHKVQQTALHRIATRLSSPLYGSMIDYYEARRLITAAAPQSANLL